MTSERDKKSGGGSSADPAGKILKVKAGGWTEKQVDIPWKEFPTPGAREALRVNFSAKAYADLICNAKEDLSSEVCGILAGEICQDSNGNHVSVLAVVRGTSARAGVNHVTYTQETWNQIHQKMEKDHPKLHIIGWYHSHPGFGVEFSDMDLFIHENFFSGSGQIAFVTDPLGGDEAICIKSNHGIEHLERFWVDGRERRCRASTPSAGKSAGDGEKAAPGAKALQAVENRLTQALGAIEELRTSYYRFLTFIGMLVAIGVIFWIGNMVYSRIWGNVAPPEVQAFLPGPVKIGNEWRWVGASLVTQKLPPEVEQKLKEAEQKAFAAALAEQQKESGGAAGGTQAQPASKPSQETSKP
ncbi:MAG: Mov34/MPN/PAD-1 family protein [Planctomycetes bacterium]|nr:Mov34/MPN/PAD-1 family protein [Planctomycetota bacterium]